MELTEEQESFVEHVLAGQSSNILLGKAGVGKSVCIKEVIDRATKRRKRFFVLAPTGVAAINVSGETIHLFLYRLGRELFFSQAAPDFILIDECSMVRADLLDKLDHALQKNTGKNAPFGGIPIALVGDCAQLPPVVPKEDKAELLERYTSAWFFSSDVFSQVEWQFHELTHIFRQSDKNFVDMLNSVRVGEAKESVKWLNANRVTNLARGTILVSTNKAAEEINLRQMDLLGGPTHSYIAEVFGDMKPSDYPTEEVLSLCVGARIMCVKNIYEKVDKNDKDSERVLILVNGDTGVVTEAGDESVVFLCDRTGKEHRITTSHGKWEKKRKVQLPSLPMRDENGKVMLDHRGEPISAPPIVEEKVVGSFLQLPVRLAWALTVHKSQGATLHEVTLDFRRRFFAEGQAYVALSRGSSLERLWLYGKMKESDVILSTEAQDFLSLRMQSRYVFQKKQQELFAHSK